jgi:hypothetical protein
METFPIIKRKDVNKFSEYRTKETILDIYDRMQQAIKTGEPFQTLLDPPPADLSVAHLPMNGMQSADSIWSLSDLLYTKPTISPFRVNITKENFFEGCEESGVALFSLLKHDAHMPEQGKVVIIRHPELKRGTERAGAAIGKFFWIQQRDVESGQLVIMVTLSSKGIPVSLKLSVDDWKTFRPLAVLVKRDV